MDYFEMSEEQLSNVVDELETMVDRSMKYDHESVSDLLSELEEANQALNSKILQRIKK